VAETPSHLSGPDTATDRPDAAHGRRGPDAAQGRKAADVANSPGHDAVQRPAGPTVRVGALIITGDGLLLVRQRRLGHEYWLLPGGGVWFGESLADALRRELREELCLEIEPGRPLAVAEAISGDMASYPKHVVHVIVQATLVDAATAARLGGDDAVLEARFFTREVVRELVVRPPIVPFLDACFDALPTAVEYLGVVW
jgi:8-oxo-dGTP diphosphatase